MKAAIPRSRFILSMHGAASSLELAMMQLNYGKEGNYAENTQAGF